jgi:hypothetical protein
MTTLTQPDPRRIRLVADGVVASYIHDISTRTSPAAPSAAARRPGTRTARLAHTRAALRGRDVHASRRPEPTADMLTAA